MRSPLLRRDPEGLYARLDIDPGAHPKTVVTAFRRKARVLHPDVPGTGDAAAFVAVKLAYDVLSNPERRAAYDRLAQQARVTQPQQPDPGEIPPSRPVVHTPAFSRQPRLSDLPLVVWIGMVAMLCLGLWQLVAHLRNQPQVAMDSIRPNAPVVAPASPDQARTLAYGPAPVRLPGKVNFYVIPASSPTRLWRQDEVGNRLVPAGQLPAFSSVMGLRLFPQNGLVEVRLTDTSVGFVEAVRLAPGDATVAHRAYCAYNAGPLPTNGEVLERHGSGPGRLELYNRSTQPAVVKLRDQTGSVTAAVYLAPEGHTALEGLPNTLYRPDFAIGELWSRACRSFAAGMRAQRMRGLVSLQALIPLTIPPDLPGEAEPSDIPDQAFEHE
jgi:hypothetical protein